MTNINLLPKTAGLGFKQNSLICLALAACLLAISLMVLWHMCLEHKIRMVVKEYNFLQQELKKKQLRSIASDVKKNQLSFAQEVINNFNELRVRQERLVGVLDAINQGIERSLFIVGLSIKDKTVVLTGKARFLGDLARLFEKLTNGGRRAITISHSIKLKEGFYEFELNWPRI